MAQRLLEGKVAVVTGSGRGIGRECALLLAEYGARVVVNDLGSAVDGKGVDRASADEVVEEIRHRGGVAVASYDSVATMEGGERIIKTAVDAFGSVDILVTPAAIIRDRMVFNMTEEEWDSVIAVNLKGTFSVVRAASVVMRQQGYGRIITFTSVGGLVGMAGTANYGASKDGIAGFTRAVARDLGSYGITVNCISPGADTRMAQTIPEVARTASAQRGMQTGFAASLRSRARPPEAIAPVVVWLASDQAEKVSGQIFHVVGGVVGLMGHPQVVRRMRKPRGPWTVEDIAYLFPATLGMELVNPAPPVAPAEAPASPSP